MKFIQINRKEDVVYININEIKIIENTGKEYNFILFSGKNYRVTKNIDDVNFCEYELLAFLCDSTQFVFNASF